MRDVKSHLDPHISYYHCGKCTEDICHTMVCPCCGYEGHKSDKVTNDNCYHESDGQLWKKFDGDDEIYWLLCVKCEKFYKHIEEL